jgi:GNAT superfamily N-acetyltransferase
MAADYRVRVSEIVIKPMRYGAPVSQQLIGAALADLGERYDGSGDDTPLSAADFDPPDGAFLVAYVDDAAAGCAGWRTHDDAATVAELKRMYVMPQYRGRGVARALISALESSAIEQGRTRMIMETGSRQPEAIALYESAGYVRIEDFGFYKHEEDVRSFGRDLI